MRRWRLLFVASALVAFVSCADDATDSSGRGDAGTDATLGGDSSTADASFAVDGSTVTIPDAGTDACASASLATDPENCGACAHSCQGGTCAGSVCQPFRVSIADASAASIAANTSGVYWVTHSGSQVLSCPPAGCPGSPSVLAGSLTGTIALAAVGTDLAVLDDSDLQNVTTPAGASVLIYPKSGLLNSGSALCTDGTPYVYFDISNGTRFITRILVDGGDPPQGTLVNNNGLDTLGCGAGHVLWEINSGSDTIYSCADPSDCGTPATIIPAANGGETHLAASATQAFFTRRQTGTLNACSIAGCPSPTVLYTSPDLNGVAVDDTYVYFTSGNGGTVARCLQSGCGASYVEIAKNQINPHALVVTKDAIYWATDPLPAGGSDAGTSAAIYRVAK